MRESIYFGVSFLSESRRTLRIPLLSWPTFPAPTSIKGSTWSPLLSVAFSAMHTHLSQMIHIEGLSVLRCPHVSEVSNIELSHIHTHTHCHTPHLPCSSGVTHPAILHTPPCVTYTSSPRSRVSVLSIHPYSLGSPFFCFPYEHTLNGFH